MGGVVTDPVPVCAMFEEEHRHTHSPKLLHSIMRAQCLEGASAFFTIAMQRSHAKGQSSMNIK